MGPAQCAIPKKDTFDNMEIKNEEKSKIKDFSGQEIIKIKTPIESLPNTERRKLNDIIKDVYLNNDTDRTVTQNDDISLKRRKVDKNFNIKQDDTLEIAMKTKVDMNFFKNKNIQPNRQFADLTMNIKSKKIETPSRSINECIIDNNSISSLKNIVKSSVKCNMIPLNREHIVKDLRSNLFSTIIPDLKINPLDTPSKLNTSQITANSRQRKKSQVFVIEQPELSDRSKDTNKDNLNSGNKNISQLLEQSCPNYVLPKNIKDKFELLSIISIPPENKLFNINDDYILIENEMVKLNENIDSPVKLDQVQFFYFVLKSKEFRSYKSKESFNNLFEPLLIIMNTNFIECEEFVFEAQLKEYHYMKIIYRNDESKPMNISKIKATKQDGVKSTNKNKITNKQSKLDETFKSSIEIKGKKMNLISKSINSIGKFNTANKILKDSSINNTLILGIKSRDLLTNWISMFKNVITKIEIN